ncbi:MAG: helix-turn-helix transcriptional regulator [Tannerellaceae bacterium]|nr:helix-turn-helix transcriptional regulator [Tannerellaceae bacterium]
MSNNESKELSLREREVLRLIARGNTNKDIADALHISLHTVLSHRKNITSKLGVKTISGLTLYALMNGLL